MQTRAFGPDPRVNGFALGFYEKSSHGLRIIGHGGDSQWFHTDLSLIPSEHLGLFVSFNTNTGGGLTFRPILEEFLDHYYPESPPPIAAPADFATRASRFTGTYRSNRRSYRTYFKAFALAGATTVSLGEDTTLVMSGGGELLRLVPVDSLLFREKRGNQLVAFEQDDRGRITHAFLGGDPTSVLDQEAWYDATALHLALWALATLASLAILIGGIVALRRHPRSPSLGRGWLVGAALAQVAFMVAVVLLSGNLVTLILNGDETPIKIALVFPILAALFTLGALVAGVRRWRASGVPVGARLRFGGAIVILALFFWSLAEWNLLGWKL